MSRQFRGAPIEDVSDDDERTDKYKTRTRGNVTMVFDKSRGTFGRFKDRSKKVPLNLKGRSKLPGAGGDLLEGFQQKSTGHSSAETSMSKRRSGNEATGHGSTTSKGSGKLNHNAGRNGSKVSRNKSFSQSPKTWKTKTGKGPRGDGVQNSKFDKGSKRKSFNRRASTPHPDEGQNTKKKLQTPEYMRIKEDESFRVEKRERRRKRNKIMSLRTSRGQPVMSGRIHLMLDKIKADMGAT